MLEANGKDVDGRIVAEKHCGLSGNRKWLVLSLGLICVVLPVVIVVVVLVKQETKPRRVPAEWEKQKMVFMQWGYDFESLYIPAFLEIATALSLHLDVKIITTDQGMMQGSANALTIQGANMSRVNYLIQEYNNAWVRDNGPVFVEEGETLKLQNWEFDAWGMNPEALGYKDDNKIPLFIANEFGIRSESFDFIMERGTIEFNGVDTVITSWPCLSSRNPGVSREEMETLFKDAWGVDKVIWLEIAPPSDEVTGGHTDGIVRFISEDTVLVVKAENDQDPDHQAFEDAARIMEKAGLDVIRLQNGPFFTYKGVSLSSNYANYLLGLDYVIVPAFNIDYDEVMRVQFETIFVNKTVYMVDIRELWLNGGGIHCVTNDVPDIPF